ncbi:hypothetical protein [Emticicia sp. TH156]|uniref:hypothetical protein n=1 Tax=Emticicia sp. TH156 TaxID=2067454 RepID=UPI000C77BFBB|nr:hypothetical protein [Emticicia sp. TH156]PLK45014.1 hypothetical protein C0V77_07165 [Emticicia sp. TH156]
MKKFEYHITPWIINKFFPHFRIKNKLEILNILLETVRYITPYNHSSIVETVGKITIIVDKMSRIFFFTEEKAYSITFPFFILEKGDEIKLALNNIEIDSSLISNLIAIISQGDFLDVNSIDFLDLIINYEVESESFLRVLQELLMYEDGYIRYDYDNDGYQEAKRNGWEHRHPLNHFDLFYTNKATFKIGLENKILVDEFIDIVDVKTDCKYMKKWQ